MKRSKQIAQIIEAAGEIVEGLSLERETDISKQVVALYRAVGAYAYSTQNKRRTQNTPGLADLVIVHPLKGVWFHELKTPEGRSSFEQETFAVRCRCAGVFVVVGGVEEAREHLRLVGLIR